MIASLLPGKGMVALAAISAVVIGWLWMDGDRLAAERDSAIQRADVAEHAAQQNALAAQRIADNAATQLRLVAADRDRAIASMAAAERARRRVAAVPGMDCPLPAALIEALREREGVAQ